MSTNTSIKKGARYYVSASLFANLVGDEVVVWNRLLTSLLYLAEELDNLGFDYNDGKVTYVELEEIHSYV